jgi:hypothetical protein
MSLRLFSKLIFVLLLTSTFVSCAVQKRHYRNGFYWDRNHEAINTISPDTVNELQKKSVAELTISASKPAILLLNNPRTFKEPAENEMIACTQISSAVHNSIAKPKTIKKQANELQVTPHKTKHYFLFSMIAAALILLAFIFSAILGPFIFVVAAMVLALSVLSSIRMFRKINELKSAGEKASAKELTKMIFAGIVDLAAILTVVILVSVILALT